MFNRGDWKKSGYFQNPHAIIKTIEQRLGERSHNFVYMRRSTIHAPLAQPNFKGNILSHHPSQEMINMIKDDFLRTYMESNIKRDLDTSKSSQTTPNERCLVNPVSEQLEIIKPDPPIQKVIVKKAHSVAPVVSITSKLRISADISRSQKHKLNEYVMTYRAFKNNRFEANFENLKASGDYGLSSIMKYFSKSRKINSGVSSIMTELENTIDNHFDPKAQEKYIKDSSIDSV